MRALLAIVVLLICLVAATWGAFSDESQMAIAHRIPVATLDVAKVFKQSREFNEQWSELRKKAMDLVTDSPSNGTDVLAKKKEFLEDEARIHATIYQRVEAIVAAICKKRDVGLVVRANIDVITPSDRGAVLQMMNRPVIFSAVPDLTDDVIAEINR